MINDDRFKIEYCDDKSSLKNRKIFTNIEDNNKGEKLGPSNFKVKFYFKNGKNGPLAKFKKLEGVWRGFVNPSEQIRSEAMRAMGAKKHTMCAL